VIRFHSHFVASLFHSSTKLLRSLQGHSANILKHHEMLKKDVPKIVFIKITFLQFFKLPLKKFEVV
jgi:hypothetical protein